MGQSLKGLGLHLEGVLRGSELHTIVHSQHLDEPAVGGIETWIEDFLEYSGKAYRVLGKSKELAEVSRGHNRHELLAIYASDSRALLPEGLRLALAVIRNRALLTKVIHVHRIELVLILKALSPFSKIIFFSHTDFAAQSRFDSGRAMQLKGGAFRLYEKVALRLCSLIISFSPLDYPRIKSLNSAAVLGAASFNDRFFPLVRGQSRLRHSVVWTGRFEPVKDPLMALRAFAESASLHEEQLLMIGSGSLREVAQSLAKELGIRQRVNFPGSLSRSELGKIFRETKVLLLTSHFEGAPRVLVEAAASGVQLITSEASDPERVAFSSGGITLPKKGSITSFAAAIEAKLLMLASDKDREWNFQSRRASIQMARIEKVIGTFIG